MNMHIQPWMTDIPADEYHAATKAGEYISSHRLNIFRRCPMEFHKVETGEIVEGDSHSFMLGRATHALILEGSAVFDRDFIVVNGPVNPKTGAPYGRETKAYREWEMMQPRPVIRNEDCALIERMDLAVHSHAKARELLAVGVSEMTVRTRIHDTPVQARLDWYNVDGDYIVDLKTCADLDDFRRDIVRFGYVSQLAFYAECVRSTRGGDALPGAWIVAVEKKEPYRVGVYQISALTLGDAIETPVPTKLFGVGVIPLLAELRECRESGVWPTRTEEVVLL